MAYHIIEYNLLPVNQLDALSVNTFDCLQGVHESKGWLASQYTCQPRLVSKYAVNWSLDCNDWITVLKTGLRQKTKGLFVSKVYFHRNISVRYFFPLIFAPRVSVRLIEVKY